ncbi:MAG: hypothetical protein JXQ29_08300 [Planctomycetes bacterium]|nr:hypothetical protein [Planctomycetota bacterium]
MSRKRKNRSKGPSPQRAPAGPVVVGERVRAALARGASKTALELAKAMAKDSPGPDADALLQEAYRARIAALLAAGLEKEAAEMSAQAASRFASPAFTEQATVVQIRTGRLSAVLAEIADPRLPDSRRQALETAIEKNLLDPRALAGAPELEPGHPLRRAAAAVSRALAEAADGALGDAARTGLGQVGRQSPLASWRAFVLALDAFHRGWDEELRAAIRRIPPDVPVAHLARILEALAEGRLPELAAGGTAARALVRAVAGAAAAVGPELARAEEAAAAEDSRQFTAAMARVLPEVAASSPTAAMRLFRWLLEGKSCLPADFGVLRPVAERALRRDEALRLVALCFDSGDEEGAFVAWAEWLSAQLEGEVRRLSDLELALACDHLAPLSDVVVERVGFLLKELGLEVADLEDPEVQTLARVMGAREGRGGTGVLMLAAGLVSVADRLRETCGVRIRFGRFADGLLDLAIDLDPTPERLECRYRRLKERKAPLSEIEDSLEQWAERHPAHVDPLLHLARAALDRDALKKAEGFVARALRIDPLSAEAREIEFHIRVATLIRHLRIGNVRLARTDLAALESVPAAALPERRGYLAAAGLHLAGVDGDEAGQSLWRSRLESAVGASGAKLYLEVVRATARSSATGKRRVAPWIRTSGSVREQLLQAAMQARLALALGQEFCAIVPLGRAATAARIQDLPDDLQDLDALCVLADREEEQDLLHLVSGKGLLVDGPLLPRFLLHRWLALEGRFEEPESAGQCRLLTIFHAARRNDTQTLEEVRRRTDCGRFFFPGLLGILQRGDEARDLAPGEARLLLERERHLQGGLKDRGPLLRAFRRARPAAPGPAVPERAWSRPRKKRRGPGMSPAEAGFIQQFLSFAEAAEDETS